MKTFVALAIVSTCLFLAGCNKTGTPTEFGKACAVENEKKYLEISGFIDDGGGVFCSNIGDNILRCGFKLKQNVGDKDGIKADIRVGTSSNQVEKISGSYKREDIKIRDNSGNLINLNDKMRVTGEMNYVKASTAGGNDVCYLNVTKIEK